MVFTVKLRNNPIKMNIIYVAVDGDWDDWSDWSTCSQTCGVGMRHRNRNCSNPIPDMDGLFCLGESIQYELCHSETCGGGLFLT